MQEKKDKILAIEKRQKDLIKEITRIAKLKPAKRFSTNFSRASKVVAIEIEIRQLQMEKKLIASQPGPRFRSGGITFIQEKGTESFINPGERVLQ